MNGKSQQFYHKYDKKIKLVEDHVITFIIVLIFVLLASNKIFIHFHMDFALNKFDKYLTSDLRQNLNNEEGVLTTVAAAFIGIYFTVFSLLGSVKIESTFAIFTEENFKRLLRFIRNAFIGSLLYLFYLLFSDLITSIWLSVVINIELLLYMLLSALRFGLIIYSIFTKDLNKFHEQLKEAKIEQIKIRNLNNRLDSFLQQQELSQETKKSLELVEKIRQREKSKKRDQ